MQDYFRSSTARTNKRETRVQKLRTRTNHSKTYISLEMDHEMSGFSIKPCGGNGGGNKCGRWNPTAEQVKVLTDLFSSGLRTPSTDQIQKISSQLSFYGKIESKNVFYWFQNHKARERQKRRRVFVSHDQQNEFHSDEKISSTKNFVEIGQIPEPERATETLQLFPVNSFSDSESEKLRRLLAGEYKENSDPFVYAFGREILDDHAPVLDLRLSFL